MPSDTPFGERATAHLQVSDALEEGVRDDRLERVELQLTGFRREADGDVVADDFEGDLVDHLRDDRVDLAGHDARAGLHRAAG